METNPSLKSPTRRVDSESYKQFPDQDSAEAAIKEEYGGQEGWTVLCADDPIKATRGYSVFRMVDREGNPAVTDPEGCFLLPPEERVEQHCLYAWPAFGKFLEPKLTVVKSVEKLVLFLEKPPDARPAHSPRENRMGFAHYDVENGISTIYQIQASVLLAAEDQHKGPILERAKAAPGRTRLSLERRKKAAALSDSLRPQAGAL